MSYDGFSKRVSKRSDIKSKRWRQLYQQQLAKTKMCQFFPLGECRFGSDCRFAHDEAEIALAPDLTKTSLCTNFQQGRCFKQNCPFAHGQEELRRTEQFLPNSRKDLQRSNAACLEAPKSSMLTAVLEQYPVESCIRADLRDGPPRPAIPRPAGESRFTSHHSAKHNTLEGDGLWQELQETPAFSRKGGKGGTQKRFETHYHQAADMQLQDFYSDGLVSNLNASMDSRPYAPAVSDDRLLLLPLKSNLKGGFAPPGGADAQMHFEHYPICTGDFRRGRQLEMTASLFHPEADPSAQSAMSHDAAFRGTCPNDSPGGTTETAASLGSHAQTYSRDASPIPSDPAYVIATSDYRSVSPGGYSNNSSVGSRSLTRKCVVPQQVWPETPSLSMLPSPNHSPSPSPSPDGRIGQPVTATDVNQRLGSIFGNSGQGFNNVYSNAHRLPLWTMLADETGAGAHFAR